jgi:bacterioferritin-associated ferredoxin
MIICICNDISEEELENHIKNGKASFVDLVDETGVCTGCGCCEYAVTNKLVEFHNKDLTSDINSSILAVINREPIEIV